MFVNKSGPRFVTGMLSFSFFTHRKTSMALSRFWSFILISIVVYIFFLLLTGQFYSLNPVVNGSQNDLLLKAEYDTNFFAQSHPEIFSTLISGNKEQIVNGKTYRLTD